MTSEPSIAAREISKCYAIYERPEDRLKQFLASPVARVARNAGLKIAPPKFYREFWALQGVSFEVSRGEALAIIGRNGAGKSSLLQIIAGTLSPTAGSISVRGRVAALLELGSGFNPEFTGRENVEMNASLFGLGATAIADRFERIAAFADIGEFIDQPVKTYSSGMMMRLAFAVQIAVEPEVLIVDEALSVGDTFFQAKCMARMRRLLDDGVTILFVSHDLSAVRQFCRTALYLERGRVRKIGNARDVANDYLRQEMADRNATHVPQSPSTSPDGHKRDIEAGNCSPAEGGDGESNVPVSWWIGQTEFAKRTAGSKPLAEDATILNVQLLRHGCPVTLIDFDDEVVFRIVFEVRTDIRPLNVSLAICTPQGTRAVFDDSRLNGLANREYAGNSIYAVEWQLRLPLVHGSYLLAVTLAQQPDSTRLDWRFIHAIPAAQSFQVAPRREGMIDGLVHLPGQFRVIDECGQRSSRRPE